MTTSPDRTRSLHGDLLMEHLRTSRTGLSTRSVVGMVLGGLRVRVLRSSVTVVSIVLAIAFLTYMGLTNQVYYNAAEQVVAWEQSGALDTATTERLIELRRQLAAAGVNIQSTLRGDAMDAWLAVMALLTCAVGIANAMLMSVTERFREIATMKCLGAQDGLVVRLFLLESSALGMVGALFGLVVGIAVAVAGAVAQFGGAGLGLLPLVEGLIVLGASLLAGVVLAVAGATYPAIIAARMRPVDALRVEE